MKKAGTRGKLLVAVTVIFSLLTLGTVLAQQNPAVFSAFAGSFLSATPTPQPARPKRKAVRPETSPGKTGDENSLNRQTSTNESNLATVLASVDFDLVGLIGTVNPATQTVPKNIPTAVLTSIKVPEGTDPAPIIAQLNQNYRIRGELTGPSFTAPRVVQAKIGEPLQIPPMPNTGDHVLQNLRIVDITDATGASLAPVTPDSVGITVIDNLLVTQVQVTEMTYEQIIQSGINLNNSNYNFYNFTLGLATSSGAVPINIPVALPSTAGQPPVVGTPTGGVGINEVAVPMPDVVPVMLEAVDAEGNQVPVELPGGETARIPGVVVFPGRIGLLHQFFEAVVIVANGAPNGTPLVVTNLKAKAKLPDAGTPNDPADDPLKIAETQQGGVVSELEVHGLGADGRYGTADDTLSFSPGQSGQASFLLEGIKEGLHTVNFDLEGTLQGLPGGNVTIRGNVPGAVLVRDAQFGVTFTHPAVVRAGQDYELGLTIFNSGSTNINGISLNLRGDSVSGATLEDDEAKTLNQTIAPGSSGTVKWKLRSMTTGQVTASYVKVGEDISAGLNLVTGVGDRNVPLSPDSLILPDPVRHLPETVIEAARQLLGQSWSVATAPAGSLPAGVLPVDKQTVVNKAVELGWAGLRVDFHENRDTSLRTLLRDWMGETSAMSSSGFADSLRNTPAGYYFYDTVGTKFYESVGAESPADFHKKLVAAESSRSSFISAYVSQSSGQQIFGAKINSPGGQSVGFGANAAERFGDLRTGAALNLLQSNPRDAVNNSKGNLLIVSKPTTSGNWSLEVTGWNSGSADISILAPTSGKNYRQLLFPGVAVTPGKRYRISFKASGTAAPVTEEFAGGAFVAVNLPYTTTDVADPNPEITGVVQVTESVIEGGDKFGRLVGVLFSKPMVKASAETATRYQIGGGALVSDPSKIIGKTIKTTTAVQNFGSRFTILALDSPVGPYIKRTVTANGITDAAGKFISNSTIDVEPRVSPQGAPPGGYLTGRVMQADGTAVPNAGIYYQRLRGGFLAGMALPPCGMFSTWETVSYQKADANGEFTIDYVREGDCHPVTVLFQNPATNSQKTLVSNVAYDGQHLIFNAVFLARGNVQGTVTSGGVPLANANVSIISELDPLNNKLVKTDAQGFYSAAGVPVGGLTVKAVGTGAYSLSSGIAAGTLNEAGGTATINVTTQNVSGVIKGKVLDSGAGQTPVANSLVIAKADIPGFPTHDGRPYTVGYAFTQADGSFTIDKLPVGNVFLQATDPQRGVTTSATVQLTAQTPRVEGVILTVSNGFGRVLGKVVNEIGQVIPNAVVQDGAQAVQADSSGNYILPRVREGTANIKATDPVTRQSGTTTISVRRNEDTTGADIVIRRPANLNGQVFISQNGTTSPLPNAYVSVDGIKIVRTDSQGRYTLNEVQSGANMIIRFVDPQGRLFVNTNVFLNPGETLSRNATFRPGRVHGRITQPDGVTPVVTGVSYKSVKPHFNQDVFFGLPEDVTLTYQTTTDGTYSFENLNPVNYRVSASNAFFPITVSQSGVLPPNGDLEINLSLVNTLAGKIHGHIYQPDGTTPVGAGVKVSLGGGSLADVTVRTDASGYYEFAEVFSEGGYTLKAIDPATNRTNQTGISVRKNQDMTVDLRLLGRGNLRVKAIDGGGAPLQAGSIRVEGSSFPSDQRYIELTPANNGEFEFTDLTEGSYAVSALYNGLGGRVSGTVTIGGTTIVTVQVQAVGSIEGRVFMPDGTTPVGLADVTLRQNGRIIGLITSQDSEEERGKFSFAYVPTGDFTVDVFDNRTGRSGRAAGTIAAQGQVANVNVNLLALGTVVGQVTSNGIPAEHALVRLSADGSGISSTNRVATTDANGNFRFPGIPVGRVYISVTNGPGGLTGQAQGFVAGTVEPLPETVINVVLTPTATVTGTVYKFGGTEKYTGALVNVSSNGFSVNTTTDETGKYRVNFVPLGTVAVKVEAPFGYDRGRSDAITSNQPGATVTADVTMAGVGNVNGTATGSDGNPLAFGKVTFTNTAWGENITVVAPVQANGTYSMTGLPAGNFSLKLTVPEIVGVGTAADTLSGGQTLVKNLQLEQAGKVFGNVKSTDGTAPAVGADVTLTLFKQGGGTHTFITHTDSSGNWAVDNLPLGTISIRISDVNTGGVALLSGLALNTNGQQLDTGSVTLDATPISVASVTPVNDATGIPINSTVQVVFSEPVDATTVSSGTVKLSLGNNAVSATRAISTDGTTVTLTPSQNLSEKQLYTVTVTTQVKDRNGIALAQEFSSKFTTADQTPPSVSSVTPANGSVEIPLNSKVIVDASEPLDAAQDLSNVIQIATGGSAVTGTTTLDQTGRLLEFTPSSNLSDSTIYTVTVNGLKDLAGNTQTTAFTSTFRTKDTIAPVVNPLPIDGRVERTFRPTITATYTDNFSGINTSSVVLTVDSVNVTSGATVTGNSLTYTPTANLSRGVHNVSVQVADNSGNLSELRTASFSIDDSGPILTSIVVGGTTLTEGAQVTSSLMPLFEVNYSDDTGINASATKLYIGFNGAAPTEVAATVTQTKMSYQPTTQMAEGSYALRAVITNNLGTLTDTQIINFTLDVDAPDIQQVSPASGNQHGGTSVVLTGSRLLNTNNSAPFVTVGNAAAAVTNIVTTVPNQVTIVTPAGVPGNAIIQVNTDRGFGRASFNYEADPRTPGSVESDTRLLWHLDETGSSTTLGANDSSPYGLHGVAGNSFLQATSGRFANGRTATTSDRTLYTPEPFGLLNFAGTGFTLETWLKTPPVSTQRTILELNNSYGQAVNLWLESSGALTARIYGLNNTQWFLSMPATTFDVDNNQWHHLALVYSLAENKMKLYVDGELRSESPKPANFDILRDHPTTPTRLFAYMNQNWTIDEVRASNSPHTAQQVLNTYLGSEGAQQTTVYPGNYELSYPRGTTNNLSLPGYNLAGVTAAATDSAGNSVPVQVVSSSATNVSLVLTVGAGAALGDGQLVITSPTNSVSVQFRITDLTRIVPDVEADTRLLWHLDETGSSTTLGANDSSPYGLHGIAGNSFLQATSGRFANGRTATTSDRTLYTPESFGYLNFVSSGFTIETWLKTPQVSTARTVYELYNNYGAQTTLWLESSGSLTGRIYSQNGVQWFVQVPMTFYDIDNNQWHHIAMVYSPADNKLKLYVDGEQRGESSKPANFDTLREYPGISTKFYAYMHQNWTLDEIRVSSTPHNAETIRQDYRGESGMRVTSTDYNEITRQSSTVTNQEFNLFGYNLENITAQILKDGQPTNVSASLISSSFRTARLNLSVPPDAPLGVAQLVVSKAGYPDSTANIRIAEKNPYVADRDTVLLWHLDETGTSTSLGAADSGVLGLHGVAGNGFLQATSGRFANGRTATISDRNLYTPEPYGALNFGANSFTMETWVKTTQVTTPRALLELNNNYGSAALLQLENGGGLTGRLVSQNGTQWSVGLWGLLADIDNNQWHHFALVADRTENKLKIYVDGELKAEAAKPAGFDAVREYPGIPTRLFTYLHQNLVQDEIRISSSAFNDQRIFNSFYGVDQFRLYRTYPTIVQRNQTSQVFITGNGLNDVAVTTNSSDVNINVVSATLSQLELAVTPTASASLGELPITLTKPGGANITTAVSVVDQRPYYPSVDTVLLWHLDETGTSTSLGAADSGVLGLHGVAGNGFLQATSGRFANGRTATISDRNLYTPEPYGALNFGANSFTMGTWVKTGPLTTPRALLELNNNYGTAAQIQIEQNGALSARVVSQNGTQWSVYVSRFYNPQTGVWEGRIDDNFWHYVVLVVDRTENKLKLYVDGVLKAESAIPAGFDAVREYPGIPTRFFSYLHQNLVQDEIQITSTAFSPERVSETFYGVDHFRLYRTYPPIVQRGVAGQITITGYGLNDVTVTSDRGDVAVNTLSATVDVLQLSVEPNITATPGNLQLTLTKPSGESLTTNLNVVNQQAVANDTGTKLLWHLDETGTSTSLGAADSSPYGLHGTAGNGFLQATSGRFANGRTATISDRSLYTANPLGLLNFGANSFTFETWVKTGPLTTPRALFELNNNYGTAAQMQIEQSGVLSARVVSQNGTQWSVYVSRFYNPQTGVWEGRIDDNFWHYVVLVVDRTENKLKIYVDGVLKAESAIPAGFDAVREYPGIPTRFFAYMHQNIVQDDIRILDFARTAQQLQETWIGTNNGFAMKKTDPQKQPVGKEIPPENAPTNPAGKTVPGDLPPKETRIKRDALKEEKR